MALSRLLTYTLLFFCLQISGQGLLIEQNGQLIRWDTPTGATDSLMMFEFDPVDHSRLAFLSDTSDMELRWSNDTAYVVKWYDVLKRDSLVKEINSDEPFFCFSTNSVRFSGNQTLILGGVQVDEILRDDDFTFATRSLTDVSDNTYRPVIHYRRADPIVNTTDFLYSIYNRFGWISGNARVREDGVTLLEGGGYFPDAVLGDFYNSVLTRKSTDAEFYANGELATLPGGQGAVIRSESFYVGGTDLAGTFKMIGNIKTIILFDFALNKGQRILTNK